MCVFDDSSGMVESIGLGCMILADRATCTFIIKGVECGSFGASQRGGAAEQSQNAVFAATFPRIYDKNSR